MSVELIVGQNCYFDITEANKMIADNFLSTEDEYIRWNELSDDDKATIIYRNTKYIENYNLFWKGCKIYNSQKMQFPRNINDVTIECPDIIKMGILMNGVTSLIKNNETDSSGYQALIDAGIQSFHDGSGASVTFSDDANTKNKYSKLPGFDKIYKNIFDTYFSKYSLII